MKQQYYFFFLEIALRKEDDLNIYAYENVSHIPTVKLVEIFNIDLKEDPNISEGYSLTAELYKKHKEYIDKHIGKINLQAFEYCLRQYRSEDFTAIRKLYKENLIE